MISISNFEKIQDFKYSMNQNNPTTDYAILNGGNKKWADVPLFKNSDELRTYICICVIEL